VCRDEYFDVYEDARSHEVLCRFQEWQDFRFREETLRRITNEALKVEDLGDKTLNRREMMHDRGESRLNGVEESRPEKHWTCEKCDKAFSGYVDAFVHERACSGNIQKAKVQSIEKRVRLRGQKSLDVEESSQHMRSERPDKKKLETRDDSEEPLLAAIYIPRPRKERLQETGTAPKEKRQEKELPLKLNGANERRSGVLKKRDATNSPPKRPHFPVIIDTRPKPPLPPKAIKFDRRGRSQRYNEESGLPATIVTKKKTRARPVLPGDRDSTIKYLCKVCHDACFDDMDSASAHEASCAGFEEESYTFMRE
jgi:hypothetical protein